MSEKNQEIKNTAQLEPIEQDYNFILIRSILHTLSELNYFSEGKKILENNTVKFTQLIGDENFKKLEELTEFYEKIHNSINSDGELIDLYIKRQHKLSLTNENSNSLLDIVFSYILNNIDKHKEKIHEVNKHIDTY